MHETIRRAEIAGIRDAIEVTRRLGPEIGATSIEVAGGLAAFTGAVSPLSQAYGVGALGPVTNDDVARMTAFYESRGAPARAFVAATADPSLERALASAGYAPKESENVLGCDDLQTHAQRDDRIGVARDLAQWARASTQAFLADDPLEPIDDSIARILASADGIVMLEVRDGDEIAATALMDLQGQCAGLFAGSTMPAFRRRGFHTALIRDRIARAGQAGASLLRATAKPGSVSERNFYRCGFVTLYSRVLWERAR